VRTQQSGWFWRATKCSQGHYTRRSFSRYWSGMSCRSKAADNRLTQIRSVSGACDLHSGRAGVVWPRRSSSRSRNPSGQIPMKHLIVRPSRAARPKMERVCSRQNCHSSSETAGQRRAGWPMRDSAGSWPGCGCRGGSGLRSGASNGFSSLMMARHILQSRVVDGNRFRR